MLSKRILELASRYLGPEAKRFLDRQAANLEPDLTLDTLKESHLEQFSWWVHMSAKAVMEREMARELAEQIAMMGRQDALTRAN